MYAAVCQAWTLQYATSPAPTLLLTFYRTNLQGFDCVFIEARDAEDQGEFQQAPAEIHRKGWSSISTETRTRLPNPTIRNGEAR